jgi:hypothetical protein
MMQTYIPLQLIVKTNQKGNDEGRPEGVKAWTHKTNTNTTTNTNTKHKHRTRGQGKARLETGQGQAKDKPWTRQGQGQGKDKTRTRQGQGKNKTRQVKTNTDGASFSITRPDGRLKRSKRQDKTRQDKDKTR